MSAFSDDWLALRESADAAARASASIDMATGTFARDVVDVIDLGSGTGANLRYLAPRLGGRQRWRLIDDDPAVLAHASGAMRAWAASRGHAFSESASRVRLEGAGLDCEAEPVRADLTAASERWAPPPRGLVTASALLDLVSADWLDALAARCAAADAAVLFALTYDGRMHLEPGEPGDDLARALVNRHQRTDKGFGPALGPDAFAAAVSTFARHGYAMRVDAADWRLGPAARELQIALLDGWLGAAVETEPTERQALTAWHRRRTQHVGAGRSRLVVGHVDIAGARPA